MLLTIDVGNTNTVVGVFGKSDNNPLDSWRFGSDTDTHAALQRRVLLVVTDLEGV